MHFYESLLSCSCESVTRFWCFSQLSESRCGFVWPFVYLTCNGRSDPYLSPVCQTGIMYIIDHFLKDVPKMANQPHTVFYIKSTGGQRKEIIWDIQGSWKCSLLSSGECLEVHRECHFWSEIPGQAELYCTVPSPARVRQVMSPRGNGVTRCNQQLAAMLDVTQQHEGCTAIEWICRY